MNIAKQLGLIVLVSFATFFVSVYLGDPEQNGLCQLNDVTCGNFYAHTVSDPFFFFSASLLITAAILLFVREATFKSWRRFAYWAIPISVLLLWIAPTTTGGGLGISFLSYTKESASWLVSGAFLLISLIIIVRKSLQAGSQK